MISVPNLTKLAHVFQMTLYRVDTNTDLTEGRGNQRTLGWFSDAGVAANAARGNYVMGTDCPINKLVVNVVRIEDGSVCLLGEQVIVDYEDPRDVRARALAKLTLKERKSLGIKD